MKSRIPVGFARNLSAFGRQKRSRPKQEKTNAGVCPVPPIRIIKYGLVEEQSRDPHHDAFLAEVIQGIEQVVHGHDYDLALEVVPPSSVRKGELPDVVRGDLIQGLRLPQDISLVGFDDLPAGDLNSL